MCSHPLGGGVTVIRGKVNKQGFGGKGSGGGGGVWLCQKKPPFPSHSDLHLLQHPEPDSGGYGGRGPGFPDNPDLGMPFCPKGPCHPWSAAKTTVPGVRKDCLFPISPPPDPNFPWVTGLSEREREASRQCVSIVNREIQLGLHCRSSEPS